MILLNLGLENQDISEAIVGTTAPPLCSSKGGTAHGEQERNFKLVIHGQRERSPMVTVPVSEGKQEQQALACCKLAKSNSVI